MGQVVDPHHLAAAAQANTVLDTYERHFDKITIPGLYEPGSDPQIDFAIEHHEHVVSFLKQDLAHGQPFKQTVEQLRDLFPSP